MLNKILHNLKSKNSLFYSDGNTEYTYNQAYKYIKNLYGYLQQKLKNKSPVIVYGHKEIYMHISFLALSFLGIAYVPIDISMPIERIDNIIADVKPQLIIGNLKHRDIENIDFSNLNSIINNNNNSIEISIKMQSDSIYYIIFTSGSTGKPKGVAVAYESLNSCVKWLYSIFGCCNSVINQAIFSFDLSICDLYLALYSGGCHFVADSNFNQDFKKYFQNLKKSNGNIAVFTPSFAELLLTDRGFNDTLLNKLEYIVFCGEVLYPNTVKKLKKRFNNIKIYNFYGPTECTFAVTGIMIDDNMLNDPILPVGIPEPGTNILIDNNGEIVIYGTSVALGYIAGDNSKFFTYNGKRAYRTGDLGYFKNNMLYCSGRIDSQIKLKGYRIELFDVEKNLIAVDGVKSAVVMPRYGKSGEVRRIEAFVEVYDNMDKYIIVEDLKKKLPGYMIPNINILENIPINSNGKIDRKRIEEEYL